MSEQHYDESFDFVVVGSGGGSMCAALLMRTLNKTVVILEKTDLVGGTTAYSGGVMWIPNNRFMAEAGLDESYEKAAAYMDATAGQSEDSPGATPVRRAAYLREAPKMVDFLVKQGVKLRRIAHYPDYYDERPGGSVPGRTVVAELFNLNELPEGWAAKLRPNFVPLPASLDELFSLATFKNSWAGKRSLLKVGMRGIMAKLTGKRWVTAGAALQGQMLKAALNEKAEVRINSAVTCLIVEEGAVKGVVTVKDGQEWRIGARLGVLVNAGGFSQSQEMRDRYIPNTSTEWTGAREGDTGEMLREMMALGAATAQMDTTMGSQMAIPPGRGNTDGKGLTIGGVGGQMELAKPHAILVDQSGVRYMNEGGSYTEFCLNMRARHLVVPAIPSWWIMDAQYMKNYMFCGTMPGSKKPQEWYDSGWLKQADTIEGLALACNIDPAVLTATLARFNTDVRAGQDTQFHRGAREYDRWLGDAFHLPSPTLGTIEQGPFYAVPMVPGDVGTFGGVVCDEHARVLREDGVPIEGLYATGTTTASVMGRYAPGAGASIGPSFTWGYVAAKHAANAGNLV
jgi:3-oxosteroid 1-dehydrogenase